MQNQPRRKRKVYTEVKDATLDIILGTANVASKEGVELLKVTVQTGTEVMGTIKELATAGKVLATSLKNDVIRDEKVAEKDSQADLVASDTALINAEIANLEAKAKLAKLKESK